MDTSNLSIEENKQMECPFCSSKELKVTDKRSSPDGIRRRRECLKCKKRFTTYETVSRENLYVVKKDGTREPFSIEKLRKGIDKAFEKRSISQDKINKMIHDIEESLRKKGRKEVKASLIGETVMKKIKKLDNVAYIRFASVYRDFQDIKDFKEEIKDL